MSNKITVGELRRHLNGLPDDTMVSFEGGLTFSRLKKWSDTEQVLIFNEIQVELSPAFKARNPEIIVAFSRIQSENSDSLTVSCVPHL